MSFFGKVLSPFRAFFRFLLPVAVEEAERRIDETDKIPDELKEPVKDAVGEAVDAAVEAALDEKG